MNKKQLARIKERTGIDIKLALQTIGNRGYAITYDKKREKYVLKKARRVVAADVSILPLVYEFFHLEDTVDMSYYKYLMAERMPSTGFITGFTEKIK